MENDSLYDRMGDTKAYPNVAQAHANEAVPSSFGNNRRGGRGSSGGPLRFNRKQMPPGLNVPSQTVFSVKVANKRAGVGGRQGGVRVKPIPRAGASLAAIKNKGRKPIGARNSQSKGGMHGGGGGGTFLTQSSVSSSSRGPSMSRRDKLGQDAQISSWLSKKKSRNINTNSSTNSRSNSRLTNNEKSSSSRNSGNNNMRAFQELRGQMDKRKEDMRRNRGSKLPNIRGAASSRSGGMFSSSQSQSTRGRTTGLNRSTSSVRSNSGVRSVGVRSTSLTRKRTTGGSGSTMTGGGSRLPRVGGASSNTKARRKAW